MDHLSSKLTIDFAQRSDAGRKPINQDTIGARLPEDGLLTYKGIAVAVADGVSGSGAAREASQSAITGFLTDYYATPETWSTGQSVQRVLQALNRYLWGLSRNNVFGEGYLTTFTCLILKGRTAYLFHVGDTRAWLWREGQLEQITRDHSQQLNRRETYLSRALGADMQVEIDHHSFELREGDWLLLSSDGVHDPLGNDGLARLLAEPDTKPQRLVERALREATARGGEDNLSLQAAHIRQLGQPSQDDAVRALSHLPFPPPLAPGQEVDGLRIEQTLHESSRSQVYRVRDAQDRTLIMKTPSISHSDDPAYIERFVMESWIGARIQSPQVARVISPPQSRSCLYYLTEFVPGPTLGELLAERGPLEVTDAVEVAGQILRGLRAFHRKETLHQDLKPDNIVMSERGPVIVDFGSCWVAGIEELEAPFSRDRILGTLDYSAPEYRYGGQTGPRSDQFSLTVLLYEMLTGQRPFGPGYSKAMTLREFQKLPYVPARRHNPLVPEWLDRAMARALSVYPQQRYEALSEWWQDMCRPNPRWQTAETAPLIERRPERVWQGLALIGWALAAGVLWWALGR